MRVQCSVSAIVLLIGATAYTAAPDTLVKKSENKIVPAAAKSWKVNGDTVTFVLAAGVDAAQWAKVLKQRLANAEVSFASGELKIAKVDPRSLLDQLSVLNLSGEGDPLAELAGLGGITAMATPEAGGSIRATNPAADAVLKSIAEHKRWEYFVAEVIDVKRGTFPTVTLKIKVRRSARSGPLKNKLQRGKVLEAPVILIHNGGSVDYSEANNQRNLVAYYLARGDRITVHAVGSDGKVAFDFVERRK